MCCCAVCYKMFSCHDSEAIFSLVVPFRLVLAKMGDACPETSVPPVEDSECPGVKVGCEVHSSTVVAFPA